jgi:hypothetical protein
MQDRTAPPAERNAGHLPGHPPWLYAQIHGRPDRQNEILIDPVGHPREITQEGVST